MADILPFAQHGQRRWTLLLAACAVAWMPLMAQKPPDSVMEKGTQVGGRVIDSTGLPLAHAAVSLRNLLTGAEQKRQPDPAGAFVFDGLTQGRYLVTAGAPNLAAYSQSMEVGRGQALNLGDIVLTVSRVSQQATVVSGSRLTELEDESPVKVIPITRQDMQNKGFERVSDVLSEVPGVVTRAQGFGLGITAGEQIDGMDSKEILVLLDGLPLAGARGIVGGFIDLNQQDVGRLERVEVVKGAASSLYGTDALGGVINLITKEPSSPIDINASVSGGTLGILDGRADFGGKWKALSAYVDLEDHHRDAYPLIPNSQSTVGAQEDRQDILAKLRYTFSPRAAVGFTSTAYHDHQDGLGSTVGVDPRNPYSAALTALRANQSTQTYAFTGDFVPTQTTTLQARLYTSRFMQGSGNNLILSGTEGPTFDVGNLREDYHRGDVSVGQQLGSRNFLQGGYEWVQDRYRGDNRIVGGASGQQLTTNDLWLQDRLQPFRNLTLTLGGRRQNNSSYGNHLVPKAGLAYRVNDHITLRAAFGLGFRAPNLGELYYHLLHLEYGYQVIGNPTLQPETSQSFSTGATFTSGRYRLSVNLFRNNLKNLINYSLICNATRGKNCAGSALTSLLNQYGVPTAFDYDSTSAALFTFVNLNIDRAYTQGFDVDGRVALTRTVSLAGAYTYLEAVNPVNHVWLPNRNRSQGHVRLEYAKPNWGLLTNVRGTFFSKWPTDSSGTYAYGYQTWSFYASKRLGYGLQAFGAIDNLANSRDPKLQEQPATFDRADYGRTFRIGLRYSLRRYE